MKRLISLFTLSASLFAAPIYAAGWTNWAAPTRIDLVAASPAGIMIFGAFGNPGPCSNADQFFLPATHPDYTRIYAAVVAALATGQQIRGYISACQDQGWYAPAGTTFPFVGSGDAVSIRN
jgi:hypothetical protein